MHDLRNRFELIKQQITETDNPNQLISLQNQLDSLKKLFTDENQDEVGENDVVINIPNTKEVTYVIFTVILTHFFFQNLNIVVPLNSRLVHCAG